MSTVISLRLRLFQDGVRAIPAEVPLGPEDGLPRNCAANLDSMTTIPKNLLQRYITDLGFGEDAGSGFCYPLRPEVGELKSFLSTTGVAP